MRAFVVIIILFLASAQCFAQAKGNREIKNFGTNPGNLKMFVYSPSNMNDIAKPLVIVLHGCGQGAGNAADLTGWNKLADLNDLIILYPEQKLANNPNFCFNWFNAKDNEKGKGECESIWQMINYMKAHYSIDTSKIVITGLSAGAAMSVAMMATHPGTFSHGAIFAGGPYKIADDALDAFKAMAGNKTLSLEELVERVKQQDTSYNGKYPRVIIGHGLNDAVVDPKSAKLLIAQWTGLHQCDTIPDKTEINYSNTPGLTRYEYHNSEKQPVVIYFEVKDLGHKLLIKPGKDKSEGGETGLFGVSSNFHSTYHVAKESGLIKNGD